MLQRGDPVEDCRVDGFGKLAFCTMWVGKLRKTTRKGEGGGGSEINAQPKSLTKGRTWTPIQHGCADLRDARAESSKTEQHIDPSLQQFALRHHPRAEKDPTNQHVPHHVPVSAIKPDTMSTGEAKR
jgi:hypothetical protein